MEVACGVFRVSPLHLQAFFFFFYSLHNFRVVVTTFDGEKPVDKIDRQVADGSVMWSAQLRAVRSFVLVNRELAENRENRENPH